MADILTILQSFLCYGNGDCVNLFNQYAYKPLEGLFYVVFFPIVFILLFIFILSSSVSPNRGFRLLISVAVFAFIIFQGWYYMFARLSEFWLFLLILLGLLWMLVHTFVGRGGGNGRAQARSFGDGFGSKLMGRAWKRVSGQEQALVKAIEADLELLSKMSPQDKEVGEVSGRIYQQLRQLREFTTVGGIDVGNSYNKLLRRYHDIMRKMKMKTPGAELPKYEKG
jgi:hypothetical protein